MPDLPNRPHPRRVGRMRSLAAVCGCETDGTPKRSTLIGNYEEPALPFRQRMRWLAKVQRLVAASSANRESYPHKVIAVANVIAHVGGVCRLSFEGMARRAGCAVNTAQACVAWLEAQGALTWSRTVRRHASGRVVRSSNLYTLIADVLGFAATMARALRPSWRERRHLSNGNGCHGLTKDSSSIFEVEAHIARKRLEDVARQRGAALGQLWLQHRTA